MKVLNFGHLNFDIVCNLVFVVCDFTNCILKNKSVTNPMVMYNIVDRKISDAQSVPPMRKLISVV